jgi:hypothetical protein
MLLRNRVGKIGVDPDLLHVRDDEQRRVLEPVGVLLQLRIGLNQVAALALVFPGEAVPLPNIGKASCIADLPSRFLEGIFGAVPIYVGRLRYSEQGAQVEKMLLSGRPFGARGPSPSGNEFFGDILGSVRCACLLAPRLPFSDRSHTRNTSPGLCTTIAEVDCPESRLVFRRICAGGVAEEQRLPR